MSILSPFKRMVSFFKYMKPQSFTYCSFPQTIKDPNVTVEKSPNAEYYLGNDGEKYIALKVAGSKKIKFSDGQKIKGGEIAYFKVEPVEWQVGAFVYSEEKITNKRGKVVKTLYHKTQKRRIVAKYILGAYGRTMSELLISNGEEEKYGKRNISPMSTVAGCNASFIIGRDMESCARRRIVRQATDFAIASGVVVDGRKAYHTFMDTNHMCASPKGKCVVAPGKGAIGDWLTFTSIPEEMTKD